MLITKIDYVEMTVVRSTHDLTRSYKVKVLVTPEGYQQWNAPKEIMGDNVDFATDVAAALQNAIHD